jgi:hypothetical protein
LYLAIGFSTLYAYQEYTEPYPFTRILYILFRQFQRFGSGAAAGLP